MAGSPATPRLSRRDLIALGGGVFAIAAIPLGNRLLGPSRGILVRRTVPVMGTFAELAVVAGPGRIDRGAAERAIDSALDRLTFVDAAMSRFRPDSDAGRVNAAAGGPALPVRPETAAVLAESLRWAEASGGAFDPCLGRACELWDVLERHEPPAESAYARLAGRSLWHALEIGGTAGQPTARLGLPEAALDLGGIAKGYGVDLAVAALREAGVEHAIVNVGGDLYAMGRSEDGDPWRIGVRSPFDPDALTSRFELTDAAVATSGDYVRRFEYHGHTYHHLLDPRTAAPRVVNRHSLSVRAPTCMAADAAATALFGMPLPEANTLLTRLEPSAGVV